MKKYLEILFVALIGTAILAGCTSDKGDGGGVTPPDPPDPPEKPAGQAGGDRFFFRIPEFENLGLEPEGKDGETIMDFSRVGYKWGDEPIPVLPVVKTLTPPAGGEDATALINGAIQELAAKPLAQRGAILLKAGEYRVSGYIHMNVSGVVLRGEGRDEAAGTRIVGTRTDDGPAMLDDGTNPSVLIYMRGKSARTDTAPASPNIIGDNTPAGRFWVRVSNAGSFRQGDNVIVKRNVTESWISALKMDVIPGVPATAQWKPSIIDYKTMERVVVRISGDTLWFENPLSICIEKEYGGGSVYKYSYADRLTGSGVENMFLTTTSANQLNNQHTWAAISINRAEHCWVKGVDSKRFGFSGVDIRQYSKNITVEDCKVTEMHASMDGSQRYPFLIKGQLSLVKDCYAETARHAFATSSPTTNGPNVFLNCEARKCYLDAGPHARLATGTLYDNVKVYKVTAAEAIPGTGVTGNFVGALLIIDRDKNGPGHGWAEINGVLWNSETDGYICVQKPWVSGNNYSVGSKGVAWGGYVSRTEGKKVSFGSPVAPQSLYQAQLSLRKVKQPGGVLVIN